MAKSRKTGSHNFFKITVLGSLLLGLIVVTGAVMMPTNTRSDASFASPPNKSIEVEVRYDDGDGAYQPSDNCAPSGKFNIGLKFTKKINEYDPQIEYGHTFSPDSNCVDEIKLIPNPYFNWQSYKPKYSEQNYTIRLRNSVNLAYTYIIYRPYEGMKGKPDFKLSGAPDTWTIDAGPNKFVKVVYGLKNTNTAKNANNPAPKKPDQPDTSSSCGAPKIDYNWSKGHSKSVTYRFTVKNNCSKKQTYRVWANVNENGTSGWSWKFATGASNKSVQKVLSAGESSGSEVTVYRADNTPKGTYKVTFYAAPCDNANNCNSNSDTNDHKQAKYTTSYRVE